MISGFLDVSTAPKTNYFYRWRPHETSNNSRITPKTIFEKDYSCKSQKSGKIFQKSQNRQAPTIYEDLFVLFEILEYGINIFQKTCNEIADSEKEGNHLTLNSRK